MTTGTPEHSLAAPAAWCRYEGKLTQQVADRPGLSRLPVNRMLARADGSILASGGLDKAPAIRAILRSGYVRRLVTNEAVAHTLLENS